jgi:hypothetical protein
MVVRSVPFYLEIQRMMTEMAADFAVAGCERVRPWMLDRNYPDQS